MKTITAFFIALFLMITIVGCSASGPIPSADGLKNDRSTVQDGEEENETNDGTGFVDAGEEGDGTATGGEMAKADPCTLRLTFERHGGHELWASTLTVEDYGFVTWIYETDDHVSRHTRELTNENLADFQETVCSAPLFSLEDEYRCEGENCATDYPLACITFDIAETHDDKRICFDKRVDMPEELDAIIDAVWAIEEMFVESVHQGE